MHRFKLMWTSKLAYAVGLLTTDGSLSVDGRHVDLTSKDKDQLFNFLDCINHQVKISNKMSGSGNISYRVQLSSVVFYCFLISIGLTANKSLSLGRLKIPKELFF